MKHCQPVVIAYARMRGKPSVEPLSTRTAVEQRLSLNTAKLNERRRDLIRAILEDAAETCFLSTPQLAQRYRVDAATLVRSVQALGYKRYADFSADLREHLMARLTPYTRLEKEVAAHRTCADQIRHSVDQDLRNISVLRERLDVHTIETVAAQIHRARRVVVVALDTAASLSWYFAYGLRTLGLNGEAPVGSPGFLDHTTLQMTRKDLMIAISFGRCSRITVEAVLRAKRARIPTFGITDSTSTAIARFCDRYVTAPVALPGLSLAAPMVAIDAILNACAHLHPDQTLAALQRIEERDTFSADRWYDPPPPAKAP